MAAENDTKMDGKSLDITKENIAALKELFPEIVEEGKIDFDKLKVILGEEVDDDNERYNFTWHGKNQAIRMSQTPSMGTLRPCKKESIDWDTTQNLYIEGDNLEVLKLLQKSYFGKVKMIYIDPPYNTGKDFVYPDNYSDNITNYKQITNQIDDAGNSISSNSETTGKYHTNWLNMIYPRLKIARGVLRDDGLIFISIDDNEIGNLIKICDEIFGENCHVATMVWQKRTSPDARKKMSTGHEYILLYCKNVDYLDDALNILDISDEDKLQYKNPDNDPRGPWRSTDFGAQGYRPNQMYKIVTPGGAEYVPSNGRCWKNLEENYKQLFKEGKMWFGADGRGVPRKKVYLSEKIGKNAWTWWPNSEVGHTQEATQELVRLFGDKTIFDYPKPVRLLKQIIKIGCGKNDIIMDFFSGSATTAQAIMELNNEDSGNRKYILVQIPEILSEGKSEYSTLCDIGEERIRRAGKEIKSAQSQTTIYGQKSSLDFGFKVFKLDSSNIKLWNPDGDMKQTLLDYENNILSDLGRTDLDIVYEIMLKMGLELTSTIDVINNDNLTLYSVSFGALMICLDEIKDTSVAEKMISIYREQKPFVWKVVFKDNGFVSDDVKANTRETLKMAGLSEGSFVTL